METIEFVCDKIFHICVDLLFWFSELIGLTYEEINVWIFIVIHPIITFIFMYLYIKYRYKYQLINKKS